MDTSQTIGAARGAHKKRGPGKEQPAEMGLERVSMKAAQATLHKNNSKLNVRFPLAC